MKKMLLSLIVFAFATVTFGQAPFANHVDREVNDHLNFNIKYHQERLMEKNSKSIESRWYNYALTMNFILNNAGSWAGIHLFPDTTINILYTDGLGTPWVHKMASTIDPKFDLFNEPNFFPGELYINQYMPYSVDSVAMNFFYQRNHPDPTIVDTLIFEVYTDSVQGDMPNYYFGPAEWVTDTYGTDTLFFRGHRFNAHDLSAKATTAHSYTFLLTEAFSNDTLVDGTVLAAVSTDNFPRVQAGKVVGVSARFIPGYTWTPHIDTLQAKNRILALSLEENGLNTYPTYTKGDYNSSSIAHSRSVYDPNDSWYELMLPEWAFVQAYRTENHLFEIKLSADVSGIGVERPTENLVTLSQNQPNPFSHTTAIRYTLNDATNVSFDLYDQTGRKVMSINRGVEAAGMHTIDIDANELSNGIYFYTLTAGHQKATKKMVVVK